MFFYTDTADAPWVIVKSNDKKRARLNCMRHFLSTIDYPNKDHAVIGAPDPLIVGRARRCWTAYTVVGGGALTGGTGACRAEAWGPDLDAADEALKAALAEYSADADVEQDFPAVGRAYAEEVRVTCGAG
jgi:hypothetical protein